MTIREATLEDVGPLVAMGIRFAGATVYATLVKTDPDAMASLATRLIANDDGLVLVAEQDGALVGMIGALLFPHHISGQMTVAELFFWVNPEQRGHGVRLLKRAERWAQTHGATTMQMIAPTADVCVLYERLGYTELERAYIKELPCQ